MNQGKLEVVNREMARVNVDILGISELKWTRMGEFNSERIFCRRKENTPDAGTEDPHRGRVDIFMSQNRYVGCAHSI